MDIKHRNNLQSKYIKLIKNLQSVRNMIMISTELRIYYRSGVPDVAIPMRDRHSGEHMFNLATTPLDKLAPDWRSKIISVTTDGASGVTFQYCGVAARFGNDSFRGLLWLWCALHQQDLVLQQLNSSLCDDSFVGTVSSMTGHLQRQFNLIEEVWSKCPRFDNTCWTTVGKVIKWNAHQLGTRGWMVDSHMRYQLCSEDCWCHYCIASRTAASGCSTALNYRLAARFWDHFREQNSTIADK